MTSLRSVLEERDDRTNHVRKWVSDADVRRALEAYESLPPGSGREERMRVAILAVKVYEASCSSLGSAQPMRDALAYAMNGADNNLAD
jgi:hypothetical protein